MKIGKVVRRTVKTPEATVIEAKTQRHVVTAHVKNLPADPNWSAEIYVDGAPFAFVIAHHPRGRNAIEKLCRGAVGGVIMYITKHARLAANRAARKEAQ